MFIAFKNVKWLFKSSAVPLYHSSVTFLYLANNLYWYMFVCCVTSKNSAQKIDMLKPCPIQQHVYKKLLLILPFIAYTCDDLYRKLETILCMLMPWTMHVNHYQFTRLVFLTTFTIRPLYSTCSANLATEAWSSGGGWKHSWRRTREREKDIWWWWWIHHAKPQRS